MRQECLKNEALSKVQYKDLDHDFVIDQENPEECMFFSRGLPQQSNSEFRWDGKNKDKYLFVIRHPISRLISAYYSFGWTHGIKARWIKDAEERKEQSEKMLAMRKKIQSLTLEEYIMKCLQEGKSLQKYQNKISKFIGQCVTLQEPDNTLVLPYEFFISQPVNFFNEVYRFLELQVSGEYILEQHKDQLTPVIDSTEKIEQEGFKTHRRSSDIHEWKNKINIDFIRDNTTRENKLLMDNYVKFLKKFNIT